MRKTTKIAAVIAVAVVSLASVSTYAAVKHGGFGKKFCRDNAPGFELTEEKKAEMLERSKEELEKRYEEGKMSEEEYKKMLEKIESGEFKPFVKRRGNFGGDFEIAEENKAEIPQKGKGRMGRGRGFGEKFKKAE